MLKVINCKHLFSKIGINDFKNNIADYHQGFMVIDGDLYIPYYRALRLGLDFSEDDVEVLYNYDYADTTARDIVAREFGRTNIDEISVMDLAEALYDGDDADRLSRLVDVVDDIVEVEYTKGFNA